MKIAMVVPTRGFHGGIERHAFDLAGTLRTRGHRVSLVHGAAVGKAVDVFTAGFDDASALASPSAAALGADVAYVHKAKEPEEIAVLGQMPVVFASHDHDHTCARSHRYLPIGQAPCHDAPGVACIARGCIVTKNRGGRGLPLRVVNPYGLRERLARLVARGPFVACSEYIRGRLVEAGAPWSRVIVVHPVPPPDARPAITQPPTQSLAVVGQLIRGKGVDIAINALAKLPAEVTLTIAGDGPSRTELEALAREVAPGRVTFLGYVTPDRTHEVYDHARVVLVPSRWPEPFGMVGIEAMRRGRVVVGANHGGIPEWLAPDGQGGRRFVPGDAKDLARAIGLALRDGGADAAAFVAKRFTHEASVERVERILREVSRPSASAA